MAHNDAPTLDDWLGSMQNVCTLLRKAFDNPGTVTKGELRKALVRHEALDKQAMEAAKCPVGVS